MREKGFTLIELLVVVFIVTILSTVVLINYRKGEDKYAFNHAVQRLVSDFRRAQNESISGTSIDSSHCGFGIKISSDNSYILYEDISPSGNCGVSNYKYTSGTDLVIETINLPDKVSFQSVGLDIFFLPPKPTTYANGAEGVNSSITLELSGASGAKTIAITLLGLIEVQ